MGTHMNKISYHTLNLETPPRDIYCGGAYKRSDYLKLLQLWLKHGDPPPGFSFKQGHFEWDFYSKRVDVKKRTLHCMFCRERIVLLDNPTRDIAKHRENCKTRQDFARKMLLYPAGE